MRSKRLDRSRQLRKALAALGPLEARIMRTLWSGTVEQPFVVRDVHEHMAELAYTTVMTTLTRLATKGLLRARAVRSKRAHEYQVVLTPEEFLRLASRQDVQHVLKRYGPAALAAFEAELGELTPEQRRRLRQMSS